MCQFPRYLLFHRFYAACVLEALAYMHERGVAYRDLKVSGPRSSLPQRNPQRHNADTRFSLSLNIHPKAVFIGRGESLHDTAALDLEIDTI